MSSDTAPNALYLLLCMVLVASALVGMRMSAGRAIKMLLAWVAIFAAGFALFAFRGEFGTLGARLASEATGAAPALVSGSSLRIAQRDDGHFWVDARVNGTNVRFLIDSGATVTTISQDVAAAAGIKAGMRVEMVSTANGTVAMPKGRADLLEVGSIRRTEFPINVNPASSTNVLGMNFLSSLSSWGVQGNTLVMTP